MSLKNNHHRDNLAEEYRAMRYTLALFKSLPVSSSLSFLAFLVSMLQGLHHDSHVDLKSSLEYCSMFVISVVNQSAYALCIVQASALGCMLLAMSLIIQICRGKGN